jgi:hypothetical protein
MTTSQSWTSTIFAKLSWLIASFFVEQSGSGTACYLFPPSAGIAAEPAGSTPRLARQGFAAARSSIDFAAAGVQ